MGLLLAVPPERQDGAGGQRKHHVSRERTLPAPFQLTSGGRGLEAERITRPGVHCGRTCVKTPREGVWEPLSCWGLGAGGDGRCTPAPRGQPPLCSGPTPPDLPRGRRAGHLHPSPRPLQQASNPVGQVSPGFREPSQQQEEGRWTEVLWPEDPAPVAGVWGGRCSGD